LTTRLRRALLRFAYWVYGLRWRIFHPITVGVRIMLVQDGAVLLIRHSYQEEWYFPGGGLKKGESLREGAVREAREEVGAVVLDEPVLLGIYTNFHDGKNDHVALFVSESFRLERPTDRWEIEECRAVPLAEIEATMARAMRRRVQEYKAGWRGLTTDW
jgi:8-oxo-dGTP pyrophosphatase MutT (NUDIX family)